MMEFLDGESLAKRIARERPMPVAEAVDVAVQTASALAAAHDKGIVHRDLKPDNLFLMSARTEDRSGGSRFWTSASRSFAASCRGSGAKTQTGAIMGTPPYMSPEQCRGITDEIDHRTDVYALGIILYEMLTGAPPFVSAGWGEVLHMHISKPPPPLRTRNPNVPAELEAVILKALAKQPDERWGSMAEIESALGKIGLGRATRDTRSVAPLSTAGRSAIPTATTLRSATGQLFTDPGDAHAAAAGGSVRQRRPAALAIGGLALVAVAVAVGLAGRRAAEHPASQSAAAPAAEPAATRVAPEPPPAAAAPSEKAAIAQAPPVAPAPATPAPSPSAVAPSSAPKLPAPLTNRSGDAHLAKPRTAPARPKRPTHSKQSEARVEPEAPAHPRLAKPNCEPNFDLDAQGEKHFKPECF